MAGTGFHGSALLIGGDRAARAAHQNTRVATARRVAAARPGWRRCSDVLLQHGDAVGDPHQAVDVVGDHHDREPQRIAERRDQLVERRGADRIEPGGRFIEQHDVGIEGQRAGEAGALAHASGELRGQLVGGIRRQADEPELDRRRARP